jgi:hypothetical protein
MLQSAKTVSQYDLNTAEIVANNFALNRTNHLTILVLKKMFLGKIRHRMKNHGK